MNPIFLKRRTRDFLAYLSWLRYRNRYQQHLVFVAALPKSGSTWLRNLFCALPGFQAALPGHITPTDHHLTPATFPAFHRRLIVMRLHTGWTPANAAILKEAGLRYFVLYRDLRDVAVSWYYDIRSRPHHYLHNKIAPLNPDQGLSYFIERILPGNVRWIQEWRTHRDPDMSRELRYEDLRADDLGVFSQAVRFCLGDVPRAWIEQAVMQNRFASTVQRTSANVDKAIVRKGVVGDWDNHFSEEHKQRAKEIAGELLIELGYEKDMNW